MNKQGKSYLWRIIFLLLFSTGLYAETNWEPPVILGTNPTDSDGSPIIVADDTGNSAVTWSEAGEIFGSYRPAGGTWETPVNFGKGVKPVICIDQGGNVTIGFIASGANGVVYAIYRPDGGTWGAVAGVHVDAGKTFDDPTIACTSTSTQATIAWANTSDSVVQSVSRTGAVWAPAVTVPTLGAGTITTNSTPQIFMLPDGNQQLAFYSDAAPEGIHWTKGSPPSLGVVTWDAPSDLGFGAAAVKFDFAVNSIGDAMIVAQDGADGFAAAQVSGSWSAASSMSLTSPSNLLVGIDKNNLVTAVWRLSGTGEIQTKSTQAAGPDWSSPVTLSTGSGNSTPILHVADDSHMIVGWRDAAKAFNTKRGEDGVFEATTAFVTTNQVDFGTIATNAEGRGFATWTETAGLTIVSVTYEPLTDPVGRLVNSLGKKRLIYQKGLYP